jgi:hypothetical protein
MMDILKGKLRVVLQVLVELKRVLKEDVGLVRPVLTHLIGDVSLVSF